MRYFVCQKKCLGSNMYRFFSFSSQEDKTSLHEIFIISINGMPKPENIIFLKQSLRLKRFLIGRAVYVTRSCYLSSLKYVNPIYLD